MYPAKLHRFLAVVLLVLLAAVPALAEKRRRSVRHRSTGERFVVTVTGTVLDDLTSGPVRNAIVTGGGTMSVTDATGKYRLRNAVGFTTLDIKVERTGYITGTHTLRINEQPEFSFRLTPTKTVRVRRVNGTTSELDIESVRFGHSATFSGYVQLVELCRIDGTRMPIDFTQAARFAGPGTFPGSGPCCSSQIARMALTLKSGETFDVFFPDSCGDVLKTDFSGRDHVGGEYAFILITDIAEIVFP